MADDTGRGSQVGDPGAPSADATPVDSDVGLRLAAWLAAVSAETGAQLVFIRGDHNMYLRNPDEVVKRIAEALNR